MTIFHSSSNRGKHKDEYELVPNYSWRNSKDPTHVVVPVRNSNRVVEMHHLNSNKVRSI